MLDLLKLTPLETEQVQLLKVMQSSAEGLMTTINNILDFCKMEAGRLMLEDIDFAVPDILHSVRISRLPVLTFTCHVSGKVISSFSWLAGGKHV